MKGLIFTYAMTYGGSVAALINPYIGLLVYVSFSIIKPDSLWYWQASEMPSYSSRIVAFALLMGWVFRTFGDWRLGRAWPSLIVLVLFLLWSMISTAQAAQPDYAFVFVEELLKIVLPFIIGLTVINSMSKARFLAWVIVLSSAYVAFEMNLSYLTGYNRVAEIGFGGMDNNCVGVAMNTTLGLALFLGLYERSWWLKGLAAASALCIAHVVLLTFSRGGMLGLAVTGVVAFFLIRKTAGHYLLAVLVVLVMIRMAGPEVQNRFFSTFASEESRDFSAQSRLDLWRDCFDLAKNYPVFGAGPRHFPLLAHTYGWPAGKEAHTLWLQAAAELGFIGVGLLLIFYGTVVWPLWRLLRSGDVPDDVRSMACMVIASLVGFAVSAQFVSLIGLEVPYYVALLGACTLKLASRARAQEAEEAAAQEEPDLVMAGPVYMPAGPGAPGGFTPRR